MVRIKIIERLEQSAHHFLISVKTECENTREANAIIKKYLKEGKISSDEERILKMQLVDSLKIVGVVVPFVLIPGASILMPILIRVASKHNIELLPSAFNNKQPNL